MRIIGIDTGTNTGLALWNTERKVLEFCVTVKIHKALEIVKNENPDFVRVEDARLRKFFGKTGREKLQGAGSIKRDAVIWEDYLTANQIPFEMVAPVNNKTKLSKEEFQRLTKFPMRTSEHARDAAMLVFGLKENYVQMWRKRSLAKR